MATQNQKANTFNFKNNNIIKKVTTWESEEFKRPNHPDFMTSSELKKAEWSGVRQNELSREWEFWIVGEIVRRVHEDVVIKDPHALTRAHMEIFGMVPPSLNQDTRTK